MKRDLVLIVVMACAAFLGGLKLAEERHRTQDDALLRQVASLSEKLTTVAMEKARVIQVPAPCPPCPSAVTETYTPGVIRSEPPAPTEAPAAETAPSKERLALAAFQEQADAVRRLVGDAVSAAEDYTASCAGQSVGQDARGNWVTTINATTPACLSLQGRIDSDVRRAAAAMPVAWENARRGGVLPGEVRRVLAQDGLDRIDWQKDTATIRHQILGASEPPPVVLP